MLSATAVAKAAATADAAAVVENREEKAKEKGILLQMAIVRMGY